MVVLNCSSGWNLAFCDCRCRGKNSMCASFSQCMSILCVCMYIMSKINISTNFYRVMRISIIYCCVLYLFCFVSSWNFLAALTLSASSALFTRTVSTDRSHSFITYDLCIINTFSSIRAAANDVYYFLVDYGRFFVE